MEEKEKIKKLEETNKNLLESVSRYSTKFVYIIKYIDKMLEEDVQDIYPVLLSIKFLLEEIE